MACELSRRMESVKVSGEGRQSQQLHSDNWLDLLFRNYVFLFGEISICSLRPSALWKLSEH